MKVCQKCKEEKQEEEFAWKKKGKLRSTTCNSCMTDYRRVWYERNKVKHKRNAKSWRLKMANQLFEFVQGYRMTHPCVDCGESDPVVLDFDHRDDVDKSFNVCDAIHRKLSLEKIKTEIEKCEMRCANCHRRRTAKQFNHKKLSYPLRLLTA